MYFYRWKKYFVYVSRALGIIMQCGKMEENGVSSHILILILTIFIKIELRI